MAAGEQATIFTPGQKAVLVGSAAVVVFSVTLLAFRVSRCRRGLWDYGRATANKQTLDASYYKAKAARQGCDWPSRLSW